jgi:cation diffusion facilitator family transporter
MVIDAGTPQPQPHQHIFLGAEHEQSERRTWTVIWLCGAMMYAEIVGGLLFGSIALVADGLHMSTHAGALLLAALAYRYARRHAEDANFTFGTGKFGDLAGFASAIVLAMIAVLIGYESVTRILTPIEIHFAEAIPIACVGLAVNIASAWLLSRGGHHHGHSHGVKEHDEAHLIETPSGDFILEVFEEGVPPRFRLRAAGVPVPAADTMRITTVRPGGAKQEFAFVGRGDFLESVATIPEPHAFRAQVSLGSATHAVVFEEHAHEHGAAGHDNNMRAAGAILLDRIPDRRLADQMRTTIENDGSTVTDLHLWRLGPGHLGAIVSVCPTEDHASDYYRAKLARFHALSHVTIEILGIN